MAQVEPMDVDAIESDFDNKENTFHHSNVLSRTPCTEKGYEELDVSELNMKLRYSVTPASSPMSKSLTGPFLDNRSYVTDDCPNISENKNLTRSLNSTLTKTEHVTKSKVLPLQTLSTDPFVDSNRNSSIRRLIDPKDNNVVISVSTNDIDDNLSLPSTSSSVAQTPEATTPTKEIPKPEGSPILRGLKSVLSMFRSSQSPIPPVDEKTPKQDILCPIESEILTSHKRETEEQTVLVSTPLAADRQKESSSSRRSSPLKESVVFNDDLARELQWRDEPTVIFKQEKIPVHKLFFRNPTTAESLDTQILATNVDGHNATAEYMDISCSDSLAADEDAADIETTVNAVKNGDTVVVESDNEFLDCETTFSKNESYTSDYKVETESNNTLIGNSTADLTGNVLQEKIEESDYKSNVNVTEFINSRDVDLGTSGKSSNSHVEIIDTKSNSYKIIQATKDFLQTEIYNHMNDNVLYSASSPTENVSLNNESQIICHHLSEDPNATRVIDNKNVSNDRTLDVIRTRHTIDNFIMNEVEERSDDSKIKDAEIALEKRERQIDILPDICPVSLNTETYPVDSPSETAHIAKLDEHIDLIEANNCINSNNNDVIKLDVTDNVSGKAEVTYTDLNPLNSQEHDKLDKMDGTQVDSAILVDNALNECALSCSKSVADVPVIINPNVKDGDMSVTEYTEIENNIPLNVTCAIDTISTVIQSNFELNGLGGNGTPMEFEDNHTREISNHDNKTHILCVSKENLSLSINITEAVEKVGVLNSIIPTTTAINNNPCMDKDRDIYEMIVESNIIRKSPSEIPLPDEEALEEDIKVNNYIADTTSSIQDKTCDESSTVNEVASSANLINSHFISTENPEQENARTFIVSFINENNSETIKTTNEGDLSKLPTCIIQSQDGNNLRVTKSEVAEDGTIMPPVNLPPDIGNKEEICDLQNAHNSIHVAEDAIEESINKSIPEINTTNTICDTTTIREENEAVIIDNTLNNADTKSVEEISAGEKKLDREPINDIEKLTKNEDKNMQPGNELVEKVEEDLITSANNSPYVSVSDLVLDMESNTQATESYSQGFLEEINNPFATKTKITSSPPISPKIVSKGYNFNFDDIDDPFATKTNIRMSPTPDALDQCCDTFKKEFEKQVEFPKKINNRRKPQPERKRSNQKKIFNSASNGQLSKKDNISKTNTMKQNLSTLQDEVLDKISPIITQYISEPKSEDSVITKDSESVSQALDETKTYKETINSSIQREEIHPIETERNLVDNTIIVTTENSTSSSEQYFSLGTSSSESVGPLHHSRNVFNLPEIDDINFNPFATKSKMRMSPPPLAHDDTILIENKNSATESKFIMEQKGGYNKTITKDPDVGDITFNKITAVDCSQNTSDVSCSSKNTNDKDETVREVLTEDEDTIEGPFLDADELKEIEKLTHLNVESDMMNFNVRPQEKDQSLDKGELFIDADAFEFLLNKNKSTTVSDSGKESLFLKFDPLFANRVSSDGVLAALSKVQKRQSTPKKITAYTQKDVLSEDPVAGPSGCKESYVPVEEYTDDISSTMTKPMMVVNPAVSSIVTPRKCTPKLNRRSLTFTSPAMAVIDRLLSLSGNSPHLNRDTSIPQHTETDLAITQLRELLAEKEIHVHNLRSDSKELKDRLAALEVQLRSMETESKERLAKINELNERVSEKTKINKSMAIVVEEYERTIASLIAESEQDKKRNAEERKRLIKDRDEQTAHLASMEVSFSDLHSKYEKSKQIILVCKSNEDTYKKSIKEFEENFRKMQNNYELLKQHATSKLNHANQELEKLNRAHEAEVLKLNAMIKRKDLHITSLEETLTQKTKANEELTAICDELINKV